MKKNKSAGFSINSKQVEREFRGNLTDFVLRRRILAHSVLFVVFVFFAGFACGGSQSPRQFQQVYGNGGLDATTVLGLPQGTHYYHGNHLGSATVITDSAGVEVTRITYSPYGEIVQEYSGVYDRATHSVVPADDSVTHKFTGQELDSETNLYYYNARYYDASIGLFTTADKIIPNAKNAMSYNRYMYVIGNPIRYTDPSGNAWYNNWNDFKTTIKKIGKNFVDNVLLNGIIGTYKQGGRGWSGIGAVLIKTFTGGIITYSKESGYGVNIGLQYGGINLGFHWQQKGFNKGWSTYISIASIGAFVSYNFNTQNSTFGVRLGFTSKNQVASAGFGYSWTVNKKGKTINNGVFTYSTLNIGRAIKLNTSEKGDGRPQNVYWTDLSDEDHKFTTGSENGGIGGEETWYMQTLDALGLHPHSVLHDFFITTGGDNNPIGVQNAFSNITGQILFLPGGFTLAGPNPDNPYSYDSIW